jgi:hypothetical protein
VTERETVAVLLGPTTTVIIPLADAVAEYFRLAALTERPRTASEVRILAALTITLGTLTTTPYESGDNEPLRDALHENST